MSNPFPEQDAPSAWKTLLWASVQEMKNEGQGIAEDA